MKLRSLFIVNTIIALPFGVGAVLAPKAFLSLYGATLDPAGSLTMQFAGVPLIGIGLLTWLARNATESETRRAIVLALLITDIVGFIVALLGQLYGVLNVLGWSTVGIYLLLALGYGYFQFAKPGAV